jgi:hypothetical protein
MDPTDQVSCVDRFFLVERAAFSGASPRQDAAAGAG